MREIILPEWVADQTSRRRFGPGSAGYETKIRLIRRFAREQATTGSKLPYEAVRQMLEGLQRGYSTSTKEISAALAPLRVSGVVDPYPNGHGVTVEGRGYRSVREAARAEGMGVETVRRRLRDPRFPGWVYTPE